MRLRRLTALLCLLAPLLAGCATAPREGRTSLDAGFRDPHSSARPGEVRTRHLNLALLADFERRTVRGRATWTLERHDPAAPLVLDVKALKIESVKSGDQTLAEARFRREPVDALRGDALVVELTPGDTRVEIVYETTPEGSGLLWLDPRQTAGKKHPYLFAQAQAIHARTFVPCQDTPAVRITFEASLDVPKELFAVMGAEQLQVDSDVGGKRRTFRFRMKQPIPAYLLAFAVGDLTFQPLGPRTGVVTEPSVIKAAAREFRDAEKMMKAVEKLYGPYRWGRFDILVLPPSFPAGGMENPRLTFVSPTLLAGDRSLVSTIAHELAHSWSGNLVTNATWGDLWLNEGFTSYIEQRVIEELYGRDRQQMECVIEEAGLKAELAELAEADEVLAVDLAGRDPDDAFTAVPYQKGALFLRRLETVFGREAFDTFLKAWFAEGAFQSRTTRDFEAFLNQRLLAAAPQQAAQVDLKLWLHGPGLPDDAPLARSAAFARIEHDVAAWKSGSRTLAGFIPARYTVHEWLHLVRSLEGLPPERLAQVDEAFLMTSTKNAEIISAWLTLAVKSGYRAADQRVEEFLLEVGRPKLIKPVYVALAATPEGLARARAILEKARPAYHAFAVREIEAVLAKAANPPGSPARS